jgi:TRAP-type C4-dicarboxylate transport system substrate-binding protein
MASDWFAKKCAELETAGYKVLSMNWIAGTRNMIGNKPIAKASDLKGLKVRGAATTIFGELMKSVGATHLTSLWSEVYTGLSSGNFDLAEANIGLLYSSNLYEVTKYLSLTAHNTMCTGLIISTSFWNTIPKEYQDVLVECSVKYGDSYSKAAVKADQEAINAFKAKGIEVIEIDVPSFVEAAKPIYSAIPGWSAGIYETVRGIIDAGK